MIRDKSSLFQKGYHNLNKMCSSFSSKLIRIVCVGVARKENLVIIRSNGAVADAKMGRTLQQTTHTLLRFTWPSSGLLLDPPRRQQIVDDSVLLFVLYSLSMAIKMSSSPSSISPGCISLTSSTFALHFGSSSLYIWWWSRRVVDAIQYSVINFLATVCLHLITRWNCSLFIKQNCVMV